MKSYRNGRGFTLIELLVAISILGVFLSAMYGILSATLKARESINNDYKAFVWGPAILDQIAEDLSHVYFYDLDDNVALLGVNDTFGVWEESDSLQFITAVRSKTPLTMDDVDLHSNISEVGYFLKENPEDPRYMILYRREDFFVNDKPYEGGLYTEIYDRMLGFNVIYYEGKEEEEYGVDEWNSKELKRLPKGLYIWIKIALPAEKDESEELWEFYRMFAFPNGTQHVLDEVIPEEEEQQGKPSSQAGGSQERFQGSKRQPGQGRTLEELLRGGRGRR